MQESVQNTLKHANAKNVDVKTEMRKDSFTAVVKDDGKGFDTTIEKEDSFGIVGMKERVKLLNGEISIHSKIRKGTLVIIQIPLC